MKRMMVGLLTVGMLLSGSVVGAEEEKKEAAAAPAKQQRPQMQTLGVGQTSCKAIAEQVEKNQQASALTYGSWVHGYLSAMNQIAYGQRRGQLNIDANRAWGLMAGHCKANPADSLIAGANKLRVAILRAQQRAAQKAAAEAKK